MSATRHELVHRLAQGYLGGLWVARRPGSGREALPALVRHVTFPSRMADAQERLTEAAWDALGIRHPNVLRLTEVVSSERTLDVIYEHVDVQPLQSLMLRANIRRLAFPVGVILRIVSDVLAALEALHHATRELETKGSYGGLSPESLLVGKNGATLLCDAVVSSVAASIEHFGHHPAKLGYTAPEQLGGGRLDARVDVFSCGVLLWELLAGRRFLLGPRPTIERRLREGQLPELRQALRREREVAPALVALVDRALMHAPEARVTTPAELARELLECGHALATPAEVTDYFEELTATASEPRITAPLSPPRARSSAPKPATEGEAPGADGLDAEPPASENTPVARAGVAPMLDQVAAWLDDDGPGPASEEHGTADAPTRVWVEPRRAEHTAASAAPEPAPQPTAPEGAAPAPDETRLGLGSAREATAGARAPDAVQPAARDADAVQPAARDTDAVQPAARDTARSQRPTARLPLPRRPVETRATPSEPVDTKTPRAGTRVVAKTTTLQPVTLKTNRPGAPDAPPSSGKPISDRAPISAPPGSAIAVLAQRVVAVTAASGSTPPPASSASGADARGPHDQRANAEEEEPSTPTASPVALVPAVARLPMRAIGGGGPVTRKRGPFAALRADSDPPPPQPAELAGFASVPASVQSARDSKIPGAPEPPRTVTAVIQRTAPELPRPERAPTSHRNALLLVAAALLAAFVLVLRLMRPEQDAPWAALAENEPATTAPLAPTPASNTNALLATPPAGEGPLGATAALAEPRSAPALGAAPDAGGEQDPAAEVAEETAALAHAATGPDWPSSGPLEDEHLIALFALESTREGPTCAEGVLDAPAGKGKSKGKKKSLRAQLSEARKLLARGQRERAHQIVCEVSTKNPRSAALQRDLVDLALAVGDTQQAEFLATRALTGRSKKKDATLLGLLGDALVDNQKLADARSAWLGGAGGGKSSEARRAQRFTKSSASLASRALKRGAYADARRLYRRALVLSQGDVEASLGYGQALLGLGEPHAALAWAERAAASAPKNGQAQLLLGDALYESGDADAAQRAWSAALELRPRDAKLRRRVARQTAKLKAND